jgi:hypothetical protein
MRNRDVIGFVMEPGILLNRIRNAGNGGTQSEFPGAPGGASSCTDLADGFKKKPDPDELTGTWRNVT